MALVCASNTELRTCRKRFDKSVEIDAVSREKIGNVTKAHLSGAVPPAYTSNENAAIEVGLLSFSLFAGEKARPLKMKSPLTTAKLAFKDGEHHAWGWSSTSVRCSADEVLAYLWDTTRRSGVYADDHERAVDEAPNEHSQLRYVRKNTKAPLSDRDFYGWVYWKATEYGYVYTAKPEIEIGGRPLLPHTVRATFKSTMKIVAVSPTGAKLLYTARGNAGGSVPTWVMNMYSASQLSLLTDIQEHFQMLRGLDMWSAQDGREVGEAVVIKTIAEKHLEKGETSEGVRVRELFVKHRGLKEVGEKYEFFETLLARVALNKLRPGFDVGTKLCDVSRREGKVIGGGLASCLATNLTADAAVGEWIGRYPALKELDKEEVWFRPMINVVAKRLLGEVSWGLKTRVFAGAGFSILDIATDVNVIILYLKTPGQEKYAMSLFAFVVANLALQLFIVWGQNKTKPRRLAMEMVIVLTGLKPAVDAARVARGLEEEEHHTVDHKTEQVGTKLVELFAEGIPGCMLQIYVLLKGGVWARQAVASVCISALTTGLTSATLSFDYDVSPEQRKRKPLFYGYIPDSAMLRTLAFGCMVANSALLLVLRSVSAALLMLVDARYFLYYVMVDTGVYFLQKIMRGDFYYWFPLDGALAVFASFLVRFMIKIVTDYTGCLQFRHVQEVGGLYWTMNMIFAVGCSNGAVTVYYNSLERWEEGVMKEADMWKIVGGLSGAWGFTFAVFLLVIKRRYWITFFDTETGVQMNERVFLNSVSDEERSNVVMLQKKIWTGIREEVKEWIAEGWWRWEEEHPKWFTKKWIGRLEDDMVPVDALREMEGYDNVRGERSKKVGWKKGEGKKSASGAELSVMVDGEMDEDRESASMRSTENDI